MTPKLLLDKQQAAESLSISVSTLERLVRDKKIIEIKLGSRCLYRLSDLESYVDSLATAQPKKRGRRRLPADAILMQ